MSFPQFKDIGKNASDLLKKGFPSTEKYAFRVECDTTTPSGIQLTPYVQETLSHTIEGELKAKFNYRDMAFTTSGNSKEDLSLEVSSIKPVRGGGKWTLALNSNAAGLLDRLRGKGTLEIRADLHTTAITFESSLKNFDPNASKVTASTVVGSKERGVAVGVEAEFLPAAQKLNSVNGALAYTTADLEASVFGKSKFSGGLSGGLTSVGASFYQRAPYSGRDIQLGGDVSYDLSGKATTFALGAAFKIDEATLKTRFDTKGLLGFSYTEKWRGPVSVTLASEWNLHGNEGNPPFQYGLKFAFK
jgi:hypothetical protein